MTTDSEGPLGQLNEPYTMLQLVYQFPFMQDMNCQNPKSRQPPTSTNDQKMYVVRFMICENCHLTVQEVRINIGSYHEILTEKLSMHPVFAKMVPQLLTSEQKCTSPTHLLNTMVYFYGWVDGTIHPFVCGQGRGENTTVCVWVDR